MHPYHRSRIVFQSLFYAAEDIPATFQPKPCFRIPEGNDADRHRQETDDNVIKQ
jgi:hypothetical protein